MLRSDSKGIQPIVPGVTNIQGVNAPLITFESLVDTDFGLMLYIDRNFLDTTVFDVEFFNSHHTIRKMIWALMNRDKWNPLYICMSKNLEAPESIADELYEEFIYNDNHYEKIIELSALTNLCDFIRISEVTGKEVRPTIVCQSEYEKDFIKKKISQYTPITLYKEIENSDIGYQQFFFRHISDPHMFYEGSINEFIGQNKTVYLADYKFNNVSDLSVIKDGSPLHELTTSANQIRIYSIYDKELYKEREETNNNGV